MDLGLITDLYEKILKGDKKAITEARLVLLQKKTKKILYPHIACSDCGRPATVGFYPKRFALCEICEFLRTADGTISRINLSQSFLPSNYDEKHMGSEHPKEFIRRICLEAMEDKP